jgi:hypothetical protein
MPKRMTVDEVGTEHVGRWLEIPSVAVGLLASIERDVDPPVHLSGMPERTSLLILQNTLDGPALSVWVDPQRTWCLVSAVDEPVPELKVMPPGRLLTAEESEAYHVPIEEER